MLKLYFKIILKKHANPQLSSNLKIFEFSDNLLRLKKNSHSFKSLEPSKIV